MLNWALVQLHINLELFVGVLLKHRYSPVYRGGDRDARIEVLGGKKDLLEEDVLKNQDLARNRVTTSPNECKYDNHGFYKHVRSRCDI